MISQRLSASLVFDSMKQLQQHRASLLQDAAWHAPVGNADGTHTVYEKGARASCLQNGPQPLTLHTPVHVATGRHADATSFYVHRPAWGP
jgi:hypothetical protein